MFDINAFSVIVDDTIKPEKLGEGNCYNWAADGDDYNFMLGADGKSSAARTNIKSGVFSIILQEGSVTNTEFANLRRKDMQTAGGYYFKLSVKNTLGTLVISSKKCKFVKNPDGGYGSDGVPTYTWDIKVLENDAFMGGEQI